MNTVKRLMFYKFLKLNKKKFYKIKNVLYLHCNKTLHTNLNN